MDIIIDGIFNRLTKLTICSKAVSILIFLLAMNLG